MSDYLDLHTQKKEKISFPKEGEAVVTHKVAAELGINVGDRLMLRNESMQTMEFGTIEEPTLITVGSIHAGDYMNIIPDTLTMEGSIRCMHENEKAVHARFTELVKAVAAAYRCECDVEINFGNSLLSNDPELPEMVKGILAESDSVNAVTDQGIREMGGDDFAEFLREGNIPGCYCLVGFGNHENGTDWPHHSKEFMVDEAVLDINVELQVRLVLRYLGMM